MQIIFYFLTETQYADFVTNLSLKFLVDRRLLSGAVNSK